MMRASGGAWALGLAYAMGSASIPSPSFAAVGAEQGSQALGCFTQTTAPVQLFPDLAVLERALLGFSFSPCELADRCEDSGRTRLWAQYRVDGDLMADELRRLGADPSSVKVAVIDTGVDRTRIDADFAVASFSSQKAGPIDADPRRDQNGHGTSVASIVVGKGGVGLAPGVHLTSYRLTDGDGDRLVRGGFTSNGGPKFLVDAVGRACSEGNEIINFSWSAELDDSGVAEIETVEKQFLKSLARRGCLVIASAGNSARRTAREGLDPDDAWLRVEASQPLDERIAAFSSLGEIRAPGESVYVLNSSELKNGARREACGGAPGGLIEGTSFATPMVSAIAAQSLAAMKRFPAYSKLSNADRVKLLNRVLQASVQEGSVNGFRAIRLVESWGKRSGSTPLPTAAALQAALASDSQAYCRTPPPPCLDLDRCDQRASCWAEARRHARVCSSSDPSVIRDLVATALSSRNFELAAQWAHRARRERPEDRAIAGGLARLIWTAIELDSARYPEQSLDRYVRLRPLVSGLDPEVDREIAEGSRRLVVEALDRLNYFSQTWASENRVRASRVLESAAKAGFLSDSLIRTLVARDVSDSQKVLNDLLLVGKFAKIALPEAVRLALPRVEQDSVGVISSSALLHLMETGDGKSAATPEAEQLMERLLLQAESDSGSPMASRPRMRTQWIRALGGARFADEEARLRRLVAAVPLRGTELLEAADAMARGGLEVAQPAAWIRQWVDASADQDSILQAVAAAVEAGESRLEVAAQWDLLDAVRSHPKASAETLKLVKSGANRLQSVAKGGSR